MFEMLQLIGGIVLSVGYIPQIIQILRTKSAKNFNVKTFVMLLFGLSCMEAYAANLAFQKCGVMYFITNTINLIIVFILFLSILKYKKN